MYHFLPSETEKVEGEIAVHGLGIVRHGGVARGLAPKQAGGQFRIKVRPLLQVLPDLLQVPDRPVGVRFRIRVGVKRARPVLAVDLLVGRQFSDPVPKLPGGFGVAAVIMLQPLKEEAELLRHVVREFHEFQNWFLGLVIEAVARPVAAVVVVVPGAREIKEGVLGPAVDFDQLGLAVFFQLREGERLGELRVAGLPARQSFRRKFVAAGKRDDSAVGRPGGNGGKDPRRLVGGQKKLLAESGKGKSEAERQI